MSGVLERLAGLLREEGGLVADALAPAGRAQGEPPRHGALAAAGPCAEGHRDEYEVIVEAVREGYLLHYASGRVVAPGDPDLALLAGDRLYALGLARLAALGDLRAVAELADVISLCAQAHAGGDAALAEAVWEAGAVAVGWGASAGHMAAKASARRGEPAAAAALLAAARASAGAAAAGS